MADQSKRDTYERMKASAKTERSSFTDQWKDCSSFISPRRGRFMVTDVNKGDRRFNNIINSAGTRYHRNAQAGMFAGSMSPVRPWFALETPDPDLMKRQDIKAWLFEAASFMREIFNGSNLYTMAPTMIGELLQFGTGCMLHVDDFDDVSRFYTNTIHSYMLMQNDRFVVDTLIREFRWTAFQIVAAFGADNVSTAVKSAYDNNNYTATFDVTHTVKPNDDYKEGNPYAKFKKFSSCYYEPGNSDKEKFLSESGFELFPAYCPRWEVTNEDTYGTNCPAMTALGDIKGLQIYEKRGAQAIEKMVNPPLSGPASLKNYPINSLPGGVNLYDTDAAKNGLRPVYQVQPNLREWKEMVNAIEHRIGDAFYDGIWMAVTNMEGIQPRNVFDLQQRDQERMLQLGPVLERLHGELLSPLIGRTFYQCAKAGIPLFMRAPQELRGMPLKVRYISSLAIAQRSVATSGIDRLTAYIGGLLQAGMQDAGDKFNKDRAIELYADALGVDPTLVYDDNQVQAIRDQRQKAQQAAQAPQQAADIGKGLNQVGSAVKQLSDPGARAALTGGTR